MINFHPANDSRLDLLKLVTAATPANGRVVIGAVEALYVFYVNQFMIVLQLNHFVGQCLGTIACYVYVGAAGFADVAVTGINPERRKSDEQQANNL